ncbi:MAG: serine hydrolase domain-containing protein [Pyrinomonadaceae bacterium]
MEVKNEQISAMLAERITAGDFASAVYLVAERGQIIFTDAVGLAVRSPEPIPATKDTIYDLASLTKPLVTGLLLASGIERGAYNLSDPIARFLPELDTADKRAITIQQLATHSSGLTPWKPLYVLANGDRSRVVELIAAEELEYAPGTAVRYSDLGFILLGEMIARESGRTLDDAAREIIFAPLSLADTGFNPPGARRTRIAASEKGNGFEREKAAGMGLGGSYAGWREDVIWGEVHDGNAYFLGGVAGHAGLFSTARETMQIAQQFIARSSQLLKPETCAGFANILTPGLEESRSVTWQLASTHESAAGPDLPPDAFGHLGFTGTSCWIDSVRERVYVLLTNRTHDHPLPFVLINDTRRRFHSLAAAALDELA